ncbi:energy-coupling factor transport system ATP-binding protein [Treponema bryantii]|uniref:Energy-coupling factor transport system ATP-binding protein n=1 Tax=Treponema bryantii TaxID=163 RepID=A0A1H9FJL8_9SPIR|nr:ABC transporter ATP-binding protein [Treponema bryantii]SEQ38160.1 energy-coupling factor transport system ATP-binding protein [Treponema bryantii]
MVQEINKETVLQAEDLTFSYMDSDEGIKNVNFEIKKGEVILLTGNSGCGKSTLLKCLNGLIPAVTEGHLSGKLMINGKEYSKLKMHELNSDIGSVFQNPRSQFFTDNTTSELVFPMENYGWTKATMEKKLAQLTEEFGLKNLLDKNIFILSSGERQMIALASALTMNQKIVLFDEPSANLDYGNAMKLGSIIERLKADGMTVIVADHRFYYLNDIIDKVFIMENGELTVYNSERAFKKGTYDTRSFDLFSLDVPYLLKLPKTEEHIKPVAELQGAGYKNILIDVNLKLYKGEITVLVGCNGTGKTTLAKLLCKTYKPDYGKVTTSSLPFFIMQDPDYQLFGTSVKNELSLVKKAPQEIDECLEYLGLGKFKDSHPFELSGGQKQRLQIGMAMLCDRDLIIFDEPTSGLDVSSMEKVSNEIIKLREKSSVLVISHDYEFIRHVADRIIFLEDGKIQKDFVLDASTVGELNQIFNKMKDNSEGFELLKKEA